MVIPYITFNGNCIKALEFYKKVFKNEIKLCQKYDDYVPERIESPPHDLSDWILHAEMEICGTKFWFSDDVNHVSAGNIVGLAATVPNSVKAREIFESLCEGGQIILPPVESFYSTFHAGVIDMFGVSWNIVAEEMPVRSQ